MKSEKTAKIKKKLESEREQIEKKFGKFTIVSDTKDGESVIIESGFGIRYEVHISYLTNEFNIKELF